MITKAHAEEIAKKLGASIHNGKKHDIAVIEFGNKRVTQFGIRRGSRNDLGHDHIPGSLHLSPNETLKMAQCAITQEEWIKRMKEKGLIGPGAE